MTLLSLGGLNCAYGVWRAARAASIPSAVFASDALWLVVQLLVYAVLAGDGLSALDLAVGWGAGLAVAALSASVLEGRAAQPSSPAAATSASGARWAYATEGALAFAGPHLTVLGAAFVLDAASISEFRAILVILGPMAIIGSGIRLVFVGGDPAGGSVTPARFVVLSLGLGTIVALVAIVLVHRLHATGCSRRRPCRWSWSGRGSWRSLERRARSRRSHSPACVASPGRPSSSGCG